MPASPQGLEVVRARWRRVRESVRLVDPESLEFASGGLAKNVSELSVRMLVLHGDPEGTYIEFTPETWAWWLRNCPSPFDTRPADWGTRSRPTADALVRYELARDNDWEQYLALQRTGALEFAGGRVTAAASQQTGPRIFWLIPIVGRTWNMLTLYSEVISEFSLPGPWEISIALVKTQQGRLGGFAAGWRDFNEPGANPTPCDAKNLFVRREVSEWPEAPGLQALAFGIGAWIEDAWGIRDRRFLSGQGPDSGVFDSSKFR